MNHHSTEGDILMNPKTTIRNHKKITGTLGVFLGCFLFFLVMRQFQK